MESLDELQHSFQSMIKYIEKNLDLITNLDLLLQLDGSPTSYTTALSEGLKTTL